MKPESCSICHGHTESKTITYTQWTRGELVAVEGVPADVCTQCAETYFQPIVANQIQKTIEAHHATKTLQVPVFRLLL